MNGKRFLPLLLFLAFLSLMSGYLMSRASLVGRIGIGLFYKQYKFLRVWWQGAMVVFTVLLLVLILLAFLDHRLGISRMRAVSIIFLLLAAAGFYFTWRDFHHTTTHRLLGGRFHIGAYLFWLGWAVNCGFFLFRNRLTQMIT